MHAWLLFVALSMGSERFEYRRPVFGVEARVVVWADDAATAERAVRAVWERAEELDVALSDWRDDGALGALAAAAGGTPIVVPHELSRCLDAALEVARASGGAFDPTIAPLTRLWREARASGVLPSSEAVRAVLDRVGWWNVEIEDRFIEFPVRLRHPGMALDLGGVAKGFAAQELVWAAQSAGAHAALVDLGGDVSFGDPPPDAAGWRMSIDGRVFELANCTVATSGADEQYLDAAGRRWSHVVDARTGLALDHARGATVIHADGALADALASAATVLTVPEAEELVARFAGARLVHRRDDRSALFDGATLAGWTTRGGRYDGDARWSVEDGAIVGRVGERGEGGLLYTDEFFSAFEFECSVKLDYPFDSGIFFHMLPPETGLRGIQVTLDHRPRGEIAALYADAFLAHNEPAAAHFRKDEWNHVRVRVTGFDPRVEVWIEDVKVLDHALPEGTAGYARHGRIGLQVHDVPVEGARDAGARAARFRDLRVRRLPLFGEGVAQGAPALDAAPDVRALVTNARHDGWRDLLEDALEGMVVRGIEDGWSVERGVLAIPAAGSGAIFSRAHFGDFDAHVEFRLAPGANSGLFLRAGAEGNPAYTGSEIQWIDDDGWEARAGAPLGPTQRLGSLYAAVPAPTWRPPVRANQWHRMEVMARGSRLACALDGIVLWDVDTFALDVTPPFRERNERGALGFQRYGHPDPAEPAAVLVRNVYVRPH